MKQKVALPAEFHFCHNFCFFLHDQLVETLISGEKAKIFDIRIKHKDKTEAEEMGKYSGKALIDWLETHGYACSSRQ